MNPAKSEIKLLLAGEWGKHMESLETGTLKRVTEIHGGKDALSKVIAGMHSVQERYQADLDAGKLQQKDAQIVMRAVGLCIEVAANLNLKSEILLKQQDGELNAYKKMLDFLERQHALERAKLEVALRSMEAGDVDAATGKRKRSPAAIDLAERRKKAKAAKASKSKKTKRKPSKRTPESKATQAK